MGGTFINLDLEAAQDAGGYARELSDDRATRQRELLTPHVADADVLITTAAIPGRPAPLLVTADMVAGMRAGSVIIDLAAESGGNVEGVVAGEDVLVPTRAGDGHVTLVGLADAPSAMASDASRLYAKNVANLLALMTTDGRVAPDFSDEVIAGACLTHDGEVRHAPTAEALKTILRRTRTNGRGFPAHGHRAGRVRRLRGGLQGHSMLHTPLLSGANAIHGIILIGAIIVAGQADNPGLIVVALLAVVLATANMVGGFVVTDRMLEMFRGAKARPSRSRPPGRRRAPSEPPAPGVDRHRCTWSPPSASSSPSRAFSSPRHARRGNLIGAAGAVLAVRHRVPVG